MHPSQQQQQQQQPSGRGLLGILVALMDGLAYSLEVSLRHDIGERRVRDMGGRLLLALGGAMLFTLVTLPAPVPAAFYNPHTPEEIYVAYVSKLGPYPMLAFCLLTLIAHGQQRWQAARRRRQGGPPIHTYYNGRPNLLRRWPNLNELYCKRVVEPAFWAGLGVLCLCCTPHLGFYLLLASAALRATVIQRAHEEREQALDTTDAVYDMLAHQEAVAAEWQPQHQTQQQPAACVQSPAPPSAPSRPPAPYQQPQSIPPAAAAPDHLRAGLNPNLNRLLDEPHLEH